jgi:aryl carrier-like protein
MAVAARGYEAPVGEVEETIARIWEELLGLERVGRHDHFFELGGHSLLVITLIERLRRKGLSVNVRTVFLAPTVVALAAAISEGDTLDSAFVVPPNLIPAQFVEPQETIPSEEFRL